MQLGTFVSNLNKKQSSRKQQSKIWKAHSIKALKALTKSLPATSHLAKHETLKPLQVLLLFAGPRSKSDGLVGTAAGDAGHGQNPRFLGVGILLGATLGFWS